MAARKTKASDCEGQLSFYDELPDTAASAAASMDAPQRQKPQHKQPAFTRATIYTDGSNYGQPGPAGYAAIIVRGKSVSESFGPIVSATNNMAELRGLIEGLRQLKPGEDALVISDSKYVVEGATTHRLPARCKANDDRPANPDLWRTVHDLSQGRVIEYRWVKGHSGDKYNERADSLAKQVAMKERDRQAKENATRSPILESENCNALPSPSGMVYECPSHLIDTPDAALLRAPLSGEAKFFAHWMVKACRLGLLPDQPFRLMPGLRDIEPPDDYAKLRYALVRNELDDDLLQILRRLHYQYKRGADVPDVRLSLQVLHREVPKMVCVIFKTDGKLIALHEATPSQAYTPLASPGGVDYAAIRYAFRLGVQEWHHWTKTEGPLHMTTLLNLLDFGVRESRDDRDRVFLHKHEWVICTTRPYKVPWIKRAIVLDPYTCEPSAVKPLRGPTPANDTPTKDRPAQGHSLNRQDALR